MKKIVLLLVLLALHIVSNSANASPDCSKLKGAAYTKCHDELMAEIRATLAESKQVLQNHYAKQEKWAQDLEKSNQHMDNVNRILDNGIERMEKNNAQRKGY